MTREGKRVTIGAKPSARPSAAHADDWVERHGAVAKKQTKRLTLDIPLALHRRVRLECARHDLVMADVIRDLLSERFPESGSTDGRRHDEP